MTTTTVFVLFLFVSLRSRIVIARNSQMPGLCGSHMLGPCQEDDTIRILSTRLFQSNERVLGAKAAVTRRGW